MAWSERMTWLLLGEKKEIGMTAAQVCALTGIDPATLQNWANRKLVEPFPAKGKGDTRVYGSQTLIYITLAQHLMRLGVAPRSAFVIADLVWGAFLISGDCASGEQDKRKKTKFVG